MGQVVGNIAAQSQEQAQQISDINRALGDLRDSTQELAQLATDSANSSQALGHQAHGLITEMQSFRLPQETGPIVHPLPQTAHTDALIAQPPLRKL